MTTEQSRWYRKRSWAEVNLDNLAHNLEVVREMVGAHCQIMGVVKSDAYGHGDCVIATELERLGVDWLGVSELEEGLAMRRYGIALPILNFTGIPVEYADIAAQHDITTIITSYDYAVQLSEHMERAGAVMKGHISLDTGIGRLGLQASSDKIEQTISEIEKIVQLPNLEVDGLYTHYAFVGNPKKEALDYTKLQYERLNIVLDELEKRGVNFKIVHSCNSDATNTSRSYHYDLVREGINLYDGPSELGFKPLMSLKTRITHIKEVEIGTKISYNCIFTATRPTKVATVSLGYGDGYHRFMSSKAEVLVSGQRVSVIGSICMDQMMLDITDVPNVNVGDVVTVVGIEGTQSIGWRELAGWAQTINYEMTCGVTRRIPRIYQKGGKDVECVAYQRFVPQKQMGDNHKI